MTYTIASALSRQLLSIVEERNKTTAESIKRRLGD